MMRFFCPSVCAAYVMSHDASRLHETMNPRQHTSLLTELERTWRRRSLPPVSDEDWAGVRTRLHTIAVDYLQMVLRMRMRACIRHYWISGGPEAGRRAALRRDVLACSAFARPEGLNPAGYGPDQRLQDHILWARGRAPLPAAGDEGEGQYFWGLRSDYCTCLAEALMYHEYRDRYDPGTRNRSLAMFVGWTYLRHFLELTVWRSDENVAAHAALEVPLEVPPDPLDAGGLTIVPGGLPVVIQAGHAALDEDTYRHRYGGIEFDDPRFRELRRRVYGGHRTVRRQLRNVGAHRSNCRACLNADEMDMITYTRIPRSRCWQSPNGVCWDIAALKQWYEADHRHDLPDHSGPLPVALFADTENPMV